MATSNKNFKVKNGLDVSGTATASSFVKAGGSAAQFLMADGSISENAGGSVEVSQTPPESPSEGDIWYNSTTGQTFVYYDSYWVENVTGQVGPQGPTGATGPAGQDSTVPGPPGPAGADGAQGPEGPPGPAGADGAEGPEGPPGTFGVFDESPADPNEGDVWFNSSDGRFYVYYDNFWVEALSNEAGPAGPEGPQGPAGPEGPQGIQGETGPIGPTGATGIEWQGVWSSTVDYVDNDAVFHEGASWFASGNPPVGDEPTESSTYWFPLALQGATGATGPQGPAGADGLDGATGPEGPQGPQGIQGEVGPAGPEGPAGADSTVPGPEGPQGPAGTDGATGPGVAAGGTTGQVLSKIDGTDYNTVWTTPISSGNFIINGAMDIWQRGTSHSGGSWTYNSVDRFFVGVNNGSGTISRETTDVPSSEFGASLKIVVGGTGFPSIGQTIEQLNAKTLAGKDVTASVYVKSNASRNMTINLRYSTAGDTAYNGSWTSISSDVKSVSADTWTRISQTYTIPSTATSLRFHIGTESSVSSGGTLYYTGFQLEEGTTATPFRRNSPSIQAELAACQRYYYSWENSSSTMGLTIGNTVYFSPQTLPVEMRVVPSVGVFGTMNPLYGANTSWSVSTFTAGMATGGNKRVWQFFATMDSTPNNYSSVFCTFNTHGATFNAEL